MSIPVSNAPALRVLVVDDEPLAAERLVRLCARLPGVEVVGTAADGQTALARTGEFAPDLMLLDIAMPGLDGVALARLLARRDPAPAVVFVTAHAAHAVTAFELAATDYLLKPVSLPRLEQAVARAAAARPARQATFLTEVWVPRGREMVRLGVDALDLLEAERDYVRLHARGQSFLLRVTLSELERRLDPARFVRVHRSAIVPLDRVRAVGRGAGGWAVRLSTGASVRVGRSFQAALQRISGRPGFTAQPRRAGSPA